MIFFTLVILLSMFTHAQNYTISSYVGDDFDYWSGGYDYDFHSVQSGSISSWIDLPFDWEFYGQSVSGYRIAHNGYITFDNSPAAPVLTNTNLPNLNGPNNAIYACWDNFTSNSTISSVTYGAAPNRVHIITWAGLHYDGHFSDRMTVAVMIYESCLDFEVVVQSNRIDPTDPSYSMVNTTIGCENFDGSIGAEISDSPNHVPGSFLGSNTNTHEVHRFSWNDPKVNDVSLINVRIDNHLTVGNHTLFGTVRNEGDAFLNSYDVNYTLNGGPVQTTTISTTPSNSIRNSDTSEWKHAIDIDIASPSDAYELKVWVSNVNGQNDERVCNDTLIEYITGIQNISADKKVLLEKNTGAWCGWCIDGAVVMDELILEHGDDLVPVVIHDGDQMEFKDSLRTSFSISSYPGAMIDRSTSITPGFYYRKESRGRGVWPYFVENQMTKFTPVNIGIDHSWDPNTRMIECTVNLDYVDNSAGDARIILMIVEDSLTGSGSGWNQANNYNDISGHPYYMAGESVNGFIHKHVLRDYAEGGCFGVDSIIPHIVSSGSNYQHTFSYELPAEFDANQISLVAAVAKYSAGNDPGYVGVRGQKNVYNVEAVHLTNPSASVFEIDESDVNVYPNPTSGNLTIDLGALKGEVELTLRNNLGQTILSDYYNSGKIIHLDLDMSSGLYILQLENNGGIYTKRIIKE